MEYYKVIDIIEKPITGEWGEEGLGIKVLRTTNFTNSGEVNYTDVVERSIESKKVEQKKLLIGSSNKLEKYSCFLNITNQFDEIGNDLNDISVNISELLKKE